MAHIFLFTEKKKQIWYFGTFTLFQHWSSICQTIHSINIAVGGNFGYCMHARMDISFRLGATTHNDLRFSLRPQAFYPYRHTVALFKVRMLFARTRQTEGGESGSRARMHACTLRSFETYYSPARDRFYHYRSPICIIADTSQKYEENTATKKIAKV